MAAALKMHADGCKFNIGNLHASPGHSIQRISGQHGCQMKEARFMPFRLRVDIVWQWSYCSALKRMAEYWISLYETHIVLRLMTQSYIDFSTIRRAAFGIIKRIYLVVVIAVCIMSSWAVGTVSAVDVLVHDAPLGSEVIITVNSTDYTDYKTMTVQANETLNITFDIPQGLETVTACAHVQQAGHLEDCSSGSGSADSKLDIYLEEIEIDNHEGEDHEAE